MPVLNRLKSQEVTPTIQWMPSLQSCLPPFLSLSLFASSISWLSFFFNVKFPRCSGPGFKSNLLHVTSYLPSSLENTLFSRDTPRLPWDRVLVKHYLFLLQLLKADVFPLWTSCLVHWGRRNQEPISLTVIIRSIHVTTNPPPGLKCQRYRSTSVCSIEAKKKTLIWHFAPVSIPYIYRKSYRCCSDMLPPALRCQLEHHSW